MLLDLQTPATSRLGLEPIKDGKGGYLYGGIVPALITEVHIVYTKHEKGEFKDMEVPALQIELENFKLNANDPDRFLSYGLKVVGSKKTVAGASDVYENRTPDEIDADGLLLWKSIKHFLESLTGSPNYRNIVNIPKEDVAKYLSLPSIDTPEKRIAEYKLFFEYILGFIMGNGKDLKPQIVTAENTPLPLWVKILPNYDKDPKRNAKFYTISRYIGQGVFEPMKVDKGVPVGTPKIIRVKPTESLTLIATPTGVPGVGAGAPSGAGIPAGAGKVDPAVQNLLS